MPHRKNFLLNRLEPDLLAQIRPHLSLLELQHSDVLAETHQRIEKVYFPHSGIISCVVELVGGGAIETGMIGNDGEFGASQALDDKVSLNHVIMQIGGTASVIGQILPGAKLARKGCHVCGSKAKADLLAKTCG